MNKKKELEGLQSRYIVGTLLAIGLLISNQIIIQYYLAQKKNDAKTINETGKQRMLSQRLRVMCYEDEKVGDRKSAIADILTEMQRSNADLIDGNPERGIVAATNVQEQELLLGLNGRLGAIRFQVDDLIEGKPYDEKLLHSELEMFLKEMDQAVSLAESEASARLKKIVLIELILFGVSILLIGFELLFFFRPLIAKALTITQDSQRKRTLLRKIAFEYAHHIRAPLANVLAVLSLFKEKCNGEDELLDLMLQSASQLDENVHQSVKELNEVHAEFKEKA